MMVTESDLPVLISTQTFLIPDLLILPPLPERVSEQLVGVWLPATVIPPHLDTKHLTWTNTDSCAGSWELQHLWKPQ